MHGQVLSAQGRTTIIAIAFFTGAWLVSVPLAILFGFRIKRTEGLFGLWSGMASGYSVVTLIALFLR